MDRLLILVISLTAATERRRTIAAALDGLGLAFEFVDALDGRSGVTPEVEREVDRAAILRSIGRDMQPGEVGCAISHVRAYRRLLASDASHALILEDDAIVDERLARFVEGRGYETAPMILLYHRNARAIGKPKACVDGVSRAVAMSPFGAVSYVLDRSAAQVLLQRQTPLSGLADWPLDISELGARAVDPQVVSHPPVSPTQSLIGTRQKRGRRLPLARYLSARYLRRMWRKAVAVRIS